jgi:hypothetical protein
MVLTAENYYSKEANKEYMSVSQYKDFAGTYGKMACEFSAVEKLEERWEQKKTTPLLVGSYVDSYFEGTLEEFKKENPETGHAELTGEDVTCLYGKELRKLNTPLMVKKGKYVTLPRYHAGASFFIAEQVRRINQYTKFTKIPLQI